MTIEKGMRMKKSIIFFDHKSFEKSSNTGYYYCDSYADYETSNKDKPPHGSCRQLVQEISDAEQERDGGKRSGLSV
jgi:hypothetical protein